MFSTKELELYIKKEISNKISGIDWKSIYFMEGDEKSKEGTYVFEKNNKYYVLLIEKGNVLDEAIFIEEKEVLMKVLNICSFSVAMKYAIENRVAGADFRRLLFQKEIEIFSLFGEEFRRRKVNEIECILQKAPYIDKRDNNINR